MFDEKTKETRTKKRHNDWKKAVRKRRITRSWGWGTDYYNNLHQYSKNKIHCSCPMCATKTRGTVTKKTGASENWDISDQRKLNELKDQLKELGEDNDR